MEVRKSTLKLALGAGCALAVLAAASTAAAEQRTFSLASSRATDTIPEFARQAGIQIVAPADKLRGVNTRALSGQYDTRQALAMLIEGTGLRIVSDDGRTVMLAVSQAPQSGSAAGDGAEVEALIVTAQKREEDIQDVPIAISAFSQEDLTRSQIAGGPDLITQVPNMTFTKTNFSSYSIQLRGIGTQAISATTDPAVAVAFNNTPFIRNRFFEQEFYDLQRVEVLRGPQGTLYGRNATAGVVNIISQKPKFVPEAKLSGDIGNFSSSRIEGMINIPLAEDAVALRLAGAWTKRDGYATNQLTGNQIDGRDLWSTRLSLRVAPNDRFDMNLIWEHFEEEDDRLRSGKQLCSKDVVTEVGGIATPDFFSSLANKGQGGVIGGVQATFSQGCARESLYSEASFQTPNGLMIPYYVPVGAIGLPIALNDPYVNPFQSPDLRVIESSIEPKYTASSDIGELQIRFDLTDELSIYSETAYANDGVYSLQDFNRFNTAPGAWGGDAPEVAELVARGVFRDDLGENIQFCDPQLGCSDRLVAVDVSTSESSQFSQEFRLASNYEGPFNFSLGANYLRADSMDKYYVFINSISLIAATGFVSSLSGRSYEGGVTDNADCMWNGYLEGDPNAVYALKDCVYIDPNPIASVNDEGHNYFLSKNPYKLISYAVFGEAYYNITENLKITAGLRWTVDKKEAPRVPTWLLASRSVGYPVAEVINQEWREPTGRLALDWKPDLSFTDDTMVYASYARGYKAGGANPPTFVYVYYVDFEGASDLAAESATRPRTFDAEFVDAFELGAKNALADGKVTLNLASFYYDYKGYQISEIVDRSAFNRNFDATVWGIELESDWRPLDNVKLGLKVGYQEAEVADGEEAIDLADRTAGDPNWTLVRPFPAYASSCILPTWLFVHDGPPAFGYPGLYGLGSVGGGGPGGCEMAYLANNDPVTDLPYVANPTVDGPNGMLSYWNPGAYPGWDPSTAPNNGEGIMKPLGGNELPNAPNLTATFTADYTIPLPNEWLATLHTDLHWQGESDWRLFQDHEYSQLNEYFTMNLAAIFVNEEQGWNIMAYIKNVTDETAITGAFLNSDDTGLTTNVFLTEPRLYGLRVTKAWTGAPDLTPWGIGTSGPHPFTLEVGGQLQRYDAPNGLLNPAWADEFEGPLAIFGDEQQEDLDWGDGGDFRLVWRPMSAGWSLAAGVRRGETNGQTGGRARVSTEPVCALATAFECKMFSDPSIFLPFYWATTASEDNHAQAFVWDKEEYEFAEMVVRRDFNVADRFSSTIGLGVQKAKLDSVTDAELRGVPDWNIPAGVYPFNGVVTHTLYDIHANAAREFEGFGPTLSWEGTAPLWNLGGAGALGVEWTLKGGVLFGDQTTEIATDQMSRFYSVTGFQYVLENVIVVQPLPVATTIETAAMKRVEDATVPTFGASLGMSYQIGGFNLGAGYRWERYFDAIDGGYAEHQSEDRTIDGPYFKIAVGFGG